MAILGNRKANSSAEQGKSAAKSVKQGAHAAGADLSEQVGALRKRIEELAEALGNTGHDKARAAVDEARKASRQALLQAEKGYGAVADHTRAAGATTARVTAERPAIALGFAAAIGLLAGYALARR